MNRIAFFILSIFCFTACNDDVDINTPRENQRITLQMTDVEKVNVYSTSTLSESTIDEMWVVVFDGTTKKWVEKIDVSNIANNGQAVQLLPQLKHKPISGWNIICVANATISVTDTAYLLPTNINQYFTMTKAYYRGGESLPMYGSMTWGLMNDGYTCQMTRAVAKVQVQMGTSVSDITGSFSPETVTFTIPVIAKSGNIQPKINTTTNTYATQEYANILQTNSATEQSSSFYIYDYPNSINSPANSMGAFADNTFNPARTPILLKHVSPTMGTLYYRLDFYDSASKKFLDIDRNHHYIFTINKVRSNGYSTSFAALNNPSSNIEYTIKIEDDAKAITSNGQYAIVTSVDTAFVKGSIAQTNLSIATVRAQLPSEMTGVIFSSESISVTSGSGLSLHSSTPTTFTSMTPNMNYQVVINTTTAFSTGSIGVITFKLGNIIHRLIVKAT